MSKLTGFNRILLMGLLIVISLLVYGEFLIFQQNQENRGWIVGVSSVGYQKISDCPKELQSIVNKYKIDSEKIVGCQAKSFNHDHKPLSFVHLEYGAGHDCFSGCFHSHYCAIVEDGEDYPYSFINSETSVTVSETGNLGEDRIPSPWDGKILTGRDNPLVLSVEFKDFLSSQTDREFRWCSR